jgi:hypothetical protein
MLAKCVSGEELKLGGEEKHSKIRPVNNGEDVAEACVGRRDESGTNARCGGDVDAGERAREVSGGLGSSIR